MVDHLSIPARHTRHAADVLAEFLGGVVTGHGPTTLTTHPPR